jgi:thiol-disulfide isomerase/thioredoxin
MATIKKFLPYLIFMSVLGMIVTGRLVFQYETSIADLNAQDTDRNMHYQRTAESLNLTLHNGEKFNLKDTIQPVIILNFWASWCTPCLKEFPTMVNLINHFGNDKIKIIGINNDDEKPEQKVERMIKKFNLNFSSYIDKGSKVTQDFKITKIPVSIIFINKKVVRIISEEFDYSSREFKQFISDSVN